jgi:hypothetical protein
MEDVIILILNRLKTKEIIKCELICHYFKIIIRKHHWIDKSFFLCKNIKPCIN